MNASILNVLMKNGSRSYEEILKKDEFEKTYDIGKYLTYSCFHFNANKENNKIIQKNKYLTIIKNDNTINFHEINKYDKGFNEKDTTKKDSENEVKEEIKKVYEDTYVVKEEGEKLEFKPNPLNIKTLYVSKEPYKKIQKSNLELVVELDIANKDYKFQCCTFLEHGNKVTMIYYDPNELEYLSNDETITVDNATIIELLRGVKSMHHTKVLDSFSQVYNFLNITLRKHKCRLKGFDEVENLYEFAVENYQDLREINKDVSYEGLCIDKCYLDEKIIYSFSSFSYLDDSMINFFNQFTYNYIMNSAQKNSWAILSTYFMSKIKQYKDSKEAYRNTWKWTRKFKRPLPLNHFIFIPINLSEVHWSLIIIAYPKYAIRFQNLISEKKATIIHLDSLGHHQLEEGVCELLKSYLWNEFENRCKSLKEKGFKFLIDGSCWEVAKPSKGVPLQNNGYDCGIYLIEYIIHLVLNQNKFTQLIPNQSESSTILGSRGEGSKYTKWFPQLQINQRRLNMKQVLKFMRDNPDWSLDELKIQHIKDKMTKQY